MDNENETYSSGGFGKDYHGQDAFGERIGGTGIGGDGHEGSFDAPDIDTTELSTTDSSFEGEANEVADSMRESIRGVNEETAENSNTGGSMDTSFQIGGTEEDEIAERLRQNKELSKENVDLASKTLNDFDRTAESLMTNANEIVERLKSKSPLDMIVNKFGPDTKEIAINLIGEISHEFGLDFDRAKLESDIKANGPDVIKETLKSKIDKARSMFVDKVKSAEDTYNSSVAAYDSYLKSSFTDKTTKSKENKVATPSEVMEESTSTKAKTKADRYSEAIRKAAANDKTVSEVLDMLGISYESSFTDKMEPSTTDAKTDKPTEAKPGKNMSSAKTSPSDYLTKSNKDSTKELPPNRNDFGNHAVDTLKGVTDRITGSVTADALGLKSIEEFARENGYNPEKLSTMKAYQSYQNKEIMKAIPGIVKQIGSYITERVKDAVDPSQLPERIRNTLARYNIATLIGAAILSMNSGAGLQASIDQALTMVDTEDQAVVSDYLEDALNDEGTVNDLKAAFDDALAPQHNSDTNELDESIVNIGRKDNTDYSGFNAGIGTTSDADVKVFITRNVKADPILRKMISKIGK